MVLRELASPTRGGPLWRLSPLTKLVVALSVALVAVSLDKVENLAILAALSFTYMLLSKPSPRKLASLLVVAGVIVWGIVVAQALFYEGYPRTVLFVIVPEATPILGPATGGVYVYLEGIWYGLAQSMRLLATLFAGIAVAWTSDPRRAAEQLRALRLPKQLCFAVTAALRFLPKVFQDSSTVVSALEIKGVKLDKSRPWTLVKGLALFYRPLIAVCGYRSYNLALAAETRGFSKGRLSRARLGLTKLDVAVIAAAAFIALAIVLAKVLLALYISGLYYNRMLINLYAWARSL